MFLPSISLEWSRTARKSKLFVNVVAGLALLFATTFGRADEANHEPDDQKDLDRLAAIWQGNLSEIKSAHIRYRSLARGTSKVVTRDVVLKLLETTDFVNRPDDARRLSEALGLGIPPEHAVWGNGELYVTGTKIRVNRDYEGRRISERVWIDAARIVFSQLNDQIVIYVRDGNRNDMKTPNDFRVIPRAGKQTAGIVEKRSADGLVVRLGVEQFVVDEGTGFVQSFKRDLVQIDPSQSSEDRFPKGRVPYPGGILFPAAIIRCRYSRGDLNFIGVDVIETATFNEPIKDEVFAVTAPAGTKVFDFRLNKDEHGYFTRIEEPVADILSEIDKRLNGPK
jgi:hypothetical protein